MYKKVGYNDADKLKNIMCDAYLSKEIKLKIPELDISINVDDTSLMDTTVAHQYICNFFFNNDYNVVEHFNNRFPIFLEIWERINFKKELGINVALSCYINDFGEETFGKDFYQIELEDSLEDKDYIYIVRNITKLYKHYRNFLEEKFGCDIISQNNEYFLVISKY